MSLKALLSVTPQYALPQHSLSVLMSRITHCRNSWVKNALLNWFLNNYAVNLNEAESSNPDDYASFNDFFTRALKPGARPIAEHADALISPADGAISQIGAIENDLILQAKGHHYSVQGLLGGDSVQAAQFSGGQFATIYLSPRDYHRLHMPCKGRLTEMAHVPGRLFSVNQITAAHVPNLFARNERVVCFFDTEFGPMALILVGAIFVSSIETVWHGVVTPPTVRQVRRWHYADQHIELDKGQELGRFNMGSTIIMLFGAQAIRWQHALQSGTALQMGQHIAERLR
jgi:phosphatidylserine decarboxylase